MTEHRLDLMIRDGFGVLEGVVGKAWSVWDFENSGVDLVRVDFDTGLRLAKLITKSFTISSDVREFISGVSWEGWVGLIESVASGHAGGGDGNVDFRLLGLAMVEMVIFTRSILTVSLILITFLHFSISQLISCVELSTRPTYWYKL